MRTWEEALPWLYRTNWFRVEIMRTCQPTDFRGYIVRVCRLVPDILSRAGYCRVYLPHDMDERLLQSARGYSVRCRFEIDAADLRNKPVGFYSQPVMRTYQISLLNQVRQLCFIFEKCIYLKELSMIFSSSASSPGALPDLLEPILSLRGIPNFSINMGNSVKQSIHQPLGNPGWSITEKYKKYNEEVVRSLTRTPAPRITNPNRRFSRRVCQWNPTPDRDFGIHQDYSFPPSK